MILCGLIACTGQESREGDGDDGGEEELEGEEGSAEGGGREKPVKRDEAMLNSYSGVHGDKVSAFELKIHTLFESNLPTCPYVP